MSLFDEHTKILIAIIKNAYEICQVNKENKVPVLEDALSYLLEQDKIQDDSTKMIVRIVLENLPKYRKNESNISPEEKIILDNISKSLESSTDIENMMERLDNMSRDFSNNPKFGEAMKIAIKILESGKNSIYDQKFVEEEVSKSFNTNNNKKPSRWNRFVAKVKEYGKIDSYGAANGVVNLGSVISIPHSLSMEEASSKLILAGIIGSIDASGKHLLLEIFGYYSDD